MAAQGYDLHVVYDPDAKDIARYIKGKLSEERYRCKVRLSNIIDGDTRVKAKVNVLLLSPAMLSYVRSNSCEDLADVFSRSRCAVLALVGVRRENYEQVERSGKALFACPWTVAEIADKETFKYFFVQIFRMLEDEDDMSVIMPETSFIIAPKETFREKETVWIIFNEEVTGQVEVQIDESSDFIKVRHRNPFVFYFNVQGLKPGDRTFRIFIDGNAAGLGHFAVRSHLDGLLRAKLEPLQFLSDCLGLDSADVGDLDLADRQLADAFGEADKLLEPGRRPLDVFSPSSDTPREIPTLLHFSAKYGLRRLARVLLKRPEATQAAAIRNNRGLTAEMLARKLDHADLGLLIADSNSEDEAGYLTMSGVSELMHKRHNLLPDSSSSFKIGDRYRSNTVPDRKNLDTKTTRLCKSESNVWHRQFVPKTAADCASSEISKGNPVNYRFPIGTLLPEFHHSSNRFDSGVYSEVSENDSIYWNKSRFSTRKEDNYMRKSQRIHDIESDAIDLPDTCFSNKLRPAAVYNSSTYKLGQIESSHL